ncbi:uncharacterized protein AB675_8768 [Cyphellophora attinorum]|uniref:Secreted protein n=1 Tax=Cyphellophora attinorum TaxID=1664694 RepID=A0A0N0NR10_9EURO|nr:uncharacterized protein AB675_8768 [Phialophora attinorum]KPI44551.1 hypothetical protein AB675_8768 [Phialophora attinorum]
MLRLPLALLAIASIGDALPTQLWSADLSYHLSIEFDHSFDVSDVYNASDTAPEDDHDVAQDSSDPGDTLQAYFDSVLQPRHEAHLNGASRENTHVLMKRGCKIGANGWECDDNIPTMTEIVDYLRVKPGGMARNNRRAAFYVNLGDVDPNLQKGGNEAAAMLVAWCQKNGLEGKYYWWANACDKLWLEKQAEHLKENRARIEKAHPEWPNPEQIFLHGFFQAMAFATTHPDVLFFTQAGKDWDKKSIWQEVEYPTLTRNRHVKRIFRIDPTCPDNKPELMWDRSRKDPLPPVVFQYPDMR